MNIAASTIAASTIAASTIVLDETIIDQRERVMTACTGYRIKQIYSTLHQAIEEFLQTLPLTYPSLIWNDPCQRALQLGQFSNIIKAHADLEYVYAFNKVHVDPKTHDIHRLLTEQNTRRQNASKHEGLPPHSTVTPMDFPYALHLPEHLHQPVIRLLSQPLANIKLPAMPPSSTSGKDARPLTVYAWDSDNLFKHFNYRTLFDFEFWTSPTEYRYANKFKASFDPERNIRMATWQRYYRKVFTSSWLQDHAQSLSFTSEFPDSVNMLSLDATRDGQQHDQRVLTDTLLLQLGLDTPRRAERRDWDEIEEEAIGLYPDYQDRKRYFVQSTPKLFYDCWGIPRSLKVRILLLPSAPPSQLEDVRTNKDDFVKDLTGLKDPFNLSKIQGALAYAARSVVLPSYRALPINIEDGRPGRMKAATKKKQPLKKLQATTKILTKEEVDTTPTIAPWLDT